MNFENASFEMGKSEKQKKWDQFREIVDGIYGIEPGIKNVVLALVANGLPTVDSCEGHVDHGRVAPRVVIEASNRPKGTRKWDSPKESTPECVAWEKRNDALLERVEAFLADFYKEREVPENIKIVCDSPKEDYWGDIVLHNGGSDYVPENLGVRGSVDGETEREAWERIQTVVKSRGEAENKALAQRIESYRAEFNEFGEFLKKKYFEVE